VSVVVVVVVVVVKKRRSVQGLIDHDVSFRCCFHRLDHEKISLH